jgi:hypothetical protein
MLQKWVASVVAGLGLAVLGLSQMVSAGEHGCCDDGCHVRKTCRAEIETKKKSVVYYDCKKVDFCLPKCSFLFGGLRNRDCCDPCGSCHVDHCFNCEHRARTKNVLLKKIKYEDECKVKCVPEEPCCELPCLVPEAISPPKKAELKP